MSGLSQLVWAHDLANGLTGSECMRVTDTSFTTGRWLCSKCPADPTDPTPAHNVRAIIPAEHNPAALAEADRRAAARGRP